MEDVVVVVLEEVRQPTRSHHPLRVDDGVDGRESLEKSREGVKTWVISLSDFRCFIGLAACCSLWHLFVAHVTVVTTHATTG